MRRHIKTYTVHPGKEKEFVEASEEFVAHTLKHEPGVVEYSVSEGDAPHTFTHFISFKDIHAEEHHHKTPRTQIFNQVVQVCCDTSPQHITLAEKGHATGVHGTHPQDEHREQESLSLYLNQDDIDEISRTS